MRLVGPSAPATKRGPPRPLRELVGHRAREARRAIVELRHERAGPVVGLRDAVGIEGVGLDDVGTGLEVGAVDVGDDLRARQRQDVVVALEIMAMLAKALAAIARLIELVLAGSWCPSRRRATRCARSSRPFSRSMRVRRSVSSTGSMAKGGASGRARPARPRRSPSRSARSARTAGQARVQRRATGSRQRSGRRASGACGAGAAPSAWQMA